MNEDNKLVKKYIVYCLLFFLFFISTSFFANAQYYDSGQDPSNVKWLQINTEHYQLIFPSEFNFQANYLANYLEKAYDYNTFSLKVKPKKLSIILHNRTIVSNAFVTWAPKRSEYYTCPPQDLYAQPWLEQLALHEYRHFVQVNKLLQGFTRLLNLPFGQQGPGAVAGVYLPRWFLEGDAVLMETLLSKSGRGRLPAFDMDLKAQLLKNGIFNYNKATFGSYKDYVPDPYTLGYNLIAVSRLKHGSKLWDNTLNYIGRNPYLGVPFSIGIHKETGLNKTALYNESLLFLDSLWKNQLKNIDLIPTKTITKRTSNFYANYRYPNYINDSEFVALKYGIDDIPCFVKIDKNGNTTKLFTQGDDFMHSFSYSENLLAWAENYSDPRWGHRTYAIIKTYNLKTKEVKNLSKRSRYFAPSISHNGKRIAAVEVSTENIYSLVILNSQTGEIINKAISPDNCFLSTPSWSNDDQNIVQVVVNTKGKSLAEYNVKNNSFKYLLPFDFTEISGPCYYKNYVLYNGTYTGIDNIFALNLNNNKIYRVTSTRFGITDPCVSFDENYLSFAEYTSNGYDVSEMILDTTKFKLLQDCKDVSLHLPEQLASQEKGIVSLPNSEIKQYETKRYSKLGHLFNFHSWAPMSIDANGQTATTGVSFMSQNLLSTMFTTAGWEYVPTENTGKYFVNFTYKGFYPIIDFKVDYRKLSSNIYHINQFGKVIFLEPFTFNVTNYNLDLRVPQDYSRSKYFIVYQPEVHTVLTNLSNATYTSHTFKTATNNYINYRLYFYRVLITSQRDLYPAWGQTFDFNYIHSPFCLSNYGNMISAETYQIGRAHV